MNLPNYFLADLPPEAPLTPGLISDACQTLKRNRERYLEQRTTEEIINILDGLAQDWLAEDYPFRIKTLEEGPAATGFSAPVLQTGLDHFFKQLTAENLNALITQELGHAERLDQFSLDHAGQSSLARGPQLIAHIAPGNIPVPVMTDMVLGLLARSAQFVKCASGQTFIPRMFAHSLYDKVPKLGACLEIAEWRGGNEPLESALFTEADCITATGSDETLAAIRAKIPLKKRFLGYGTRVSFGYVTKDVLSGHRPQAIAEHAAQDVIAWNQMGCLSPHVFYVETGGKVLPEHFAQLLSEQLEKLEATHPRGTLSAQESAAIATRRAFYEVRVAHSPDTMMWSSPASTAWTVVYELDSRFQISCLNRFIHVKAVADVTQALQEAELIHDKISTIGFAASATQVKELVNRFAKFGATRICPLGQMQNPSLTWRHDGRPALGDLVTWCNLEK